MSNKPNPNNPFAGLWQSFIFLSIDDGRDKKWKAIEELVLTLARLDLASTHYQDYGYKDEHEWEEKLRIKASIWAWHSVKRKRKFKERINANRSRNQTLTLAREFVEQKHKNYLTSPSYNDSS